MVMVFKPDWSVNVANIAVVVMAILGGIGAWYDVKADTRINTRDIVALQAINDKHEKQDTYNDQKQDEKRNAVVLDIKNVLKDNRDEIKADIRDLRNDLFRKK